MADLSKKISEIKRENKTIEKYRESMDRFNYLIQRGLIKKRVSPNLGKCEVHCHTFYTN